MRLILTILFIFSLNANAAEQALIVDQQQCATLQSEGASQEQMARRGCCSWHGGVCGCSGSTVVCCDGQNSPSCTCHKDDRGNVRPPEAETPKL